MSAVNWLLFVLLERIFESGVERFNDPRNFFAVERISSSKGAWTGFDHRHDRSGSSLRDELFCRFFACCLGCVHEFLLFCMGFLHRITPLNPVACQPSKELPMNGMLYTA